MRCMILFIHVNTIVKILRVNKVYQFDVFLSVSVILFFSGLLLLLH